MRQLAEQVAQLRAEVAQLREQAFVLRTLEEMRVRMMDGALPVAPVRQRHLRAVQAQ
jgi:hypothetical protein